MRGKDPQFYILDAERIKRGEATDIYFIRSRNILEKYGMCNRMVRYEIHAYSLPRNYKWAVFTGLEEALALLMNKNVVFYSLPEGTIFKEIQPLAVVEGRICDIIHLETALLGILRFYSSVSTKAARIKKLAGDKQVLFFGLRAHHPAITPALDRAAYIGGCDAVSGVTSKEFMDIEPKGTMPHVLIIVFGDPIKAFQAFDDVVLEDVPRIALIDTFYDERYESELAIQAFGKRLWGVRLDTPRSRRGDIYMIAQEVKWTLKLHGFNDVKIIISGGVDEENITKLKEVADGFGVGTSIAFPPSIDLSMDVVEIYDEDRRIWIPITKRGKLPGMKQLYRCKPIYEDYIDVPNKEIKCSDGSQAKPMLIKYLDNGQLVRTLPSPQEIRKYVLDQLNHVE